MASTFRSMTSSAPKTSSAYAWIIRKFTCEDMCIPNYTTSFNSISRYQLESHISITHHGELSTKWFCELRRFLEKLTPSKMHLYLHVDNKKSFDYRKREMEGLNVVEVENLTMNTNGLPTLSFQVVLDALFRMCRPKMITQCDIHPRDTNNAINNYVVLCRELELGLKVKSFLIPSQYMYALHDLEEVNVETFSRGVWRPQPLDSILDDDDDDDDSQRRIRLQLKWKQSTGYPYLPRASFPISIMPGLESADDEYFSYSLPDPMIMPGLESADDDEYLCDQSLPDHIIHRIQSLLSHRKAAQTSVLSKCV